MNRKLLAAGFIGLGIMIGTAVIASEKSDVSASYYSEEQIERAAPIYAQQCASCHGGDLQGSASAPGLAGIGFLFYWEDRSVLELLDYVSETMPLGRPGGLSDQQYVDVVAYILHANDLVGGEEELPIAREVLGEVLIEKEGEAETD